jgi:hypothetical protein
MANANIFQQYLRPPKSVMEYGAELDAEEASALDIAGKRSRNELAALTMDQTRGQIADASAKRNAIQQVFAQLGPQATPIARARALQANPLTAADGVAAEKAILENDKLGAQAGKEGAEADKTRLANGLQTFEIVGQLMGGVRDQATYDAARQQAASVFGPEFAAKMDPVYNPQAIAQKQAQAMSVKERLEQEWKAKGYDRDIANDKERVRQFGVTTAEQQRHNRTTEGISGGHLSLARTKDAREATQSKAPSGYRAKPDGSLEFIPGGPADPNAARRAAPTEDERKAAGWLDQANNAFANMEKAIADDAGSAKPGLIESLPLVAEPIKNMSRSDARQRFSQGASSFAEAALRAATGAGVNESEAKQKIAELTPQWGDTAGNIAQKREGLKVYLGSLATRAGRAGTKTATADAGGVVDFASLK